MKFKLGVWKQNVTTSLRNLSQRIAPKTRIIVKVSQTLKVKQIRKKTRKKQTLRVNCGAVNVLWSATNFQNYPVTGVYCQTPRDLLRCLLRWFALIDAANNCLQARTRPRFV